MSETAKAFIDLRTHMEQRTVPHNQVILAHKALFVLAQSLLAGAYRSTEKVVA